MIINLAISTVMGIRTDRFMDIDVDMPMFIRSQIAQLKLARLQNYDQRDPKNIQSRKTQNKKQKKKKTKKKQIKHGANMGFRTAC